MEENTKTNVVQENTEKMVFLTTADVARTLGCTEQTARKLFKRDEFPSIQVEKITKYLKANSSLGATVKGSSTTNLTSLDKAVITVLSRLIFCLYQLKEC